MSIQFYSLIFDKTKCPQFLKKTRTGSPRITELPARLRNLRNLKQLVAVNGYQNRPPQGLRVFRNRPEVVILGADQKNRGLWGREFNHPATKKALRLTVQFEFISSLVIRTFSNERNEPSLTYKNFEAEKSYAAKKHRFQTSLEDNAN